MSRWENPKPEDIRERNAVRRLRLSAAQEAGTHSHEEWELLLHACRHACVRCGSSGHLHKDHIRPLCDGGSDAIENIQPLCKSCNSSKGLDASDLRPHGWPEVLAAYRKAQEEAFLP